jgi:CheY-like chemotaxis protein
MMPDEPAYPPQLRGLRVLIVEDEAMVSMLLEDILGELGCDFAGPAFNLSQAVSMAKSETPLDAAILDVNLAGAEIYPVAEVLAGRNVPFVFATGYGADGVAEHWRSRPRLQKPFSIQQVARVLADAVEGTPGAGPSKSGP